MAKQMDIDIVGAIKVKDGIFIGDEFGAQDLEFVVANKVTHIINTCNRQIPNHWETIGVIYLSYNWNNRDQIILDQKDKVSNDTFQFMETALYKGESVLIHSVKGQSRCCTIVTAYLMRKYRWSLSKAIDFMKFRRPDLNIKTVFLQQLASFEIRLPKILKIPLTTQWSDLSEKTFLLENEELALRNTYLNAQIIPPCKPDYHARSNFKVGWIDHINLNPKNSKEILKGPNNADLGSVIPANITELNMNKKIITHKFKSQLKPLLKTSSHSGKEGKMEDTTDSNFFNEEEKLEAKEESDFNKELNKMIQNSGPSNNLKEGNPHNNFMYNLLQNDNVKVGEESKNIKLNFPPTKNNIKNHGIVTNIINNNNINNIIIQTPQDVDLKSLGILTHLNNKEEKKSMRSASAKTKEKGQIKASKDTNFDGAELGNEISPYKGINVIMSGEVPNNQKRNCKTPNFPKSGLKEIEGIHNDNPITKELDLIKEQNELSKKWKQQEMKEEYIPFQSPESKNFISSNIFSQNISNNRWAYNNSNINNALNPMRAGPVKVKNDKKDNVRPSKYIEQIFENDQKKSATKKDRKPHYSANLRPSSPGIKGKKAENPYSTIVNKVSLSIQGQKRLGSANTKNPPLQYKKPTANKFDSKGITPTKAKYKY